MINRADLHRLVDDLDEAAVPRAAILLRLATVPDDDEAVTDDDRAAIEAGRLEYERGETVGLADVRDQV